MTFFLFLVVGISVVLALALLVMFFNPSSVGLATTVRRFSNVAIHEQNRESLVEFSEEDDQALIEIESDRALLQDIDATSETESDRIVPWQVITVAVAIPIAAFLLYWFLWGRPGTLLLQEAASLMSNETASEVGQVEDLLVAYTDMHPEDEVAWQRLLTYQWFMEEPQSFRQTFSKAMEQEVSSPYTDSLYVLDAFRQRQLNLTPQDRRILDRLRETSEESPVLSLIDALSYTTQGDYARANESWENIQSRVDLFGLHETARLGQLATRNRLLPESASRVSVEVVFNTRPDAYRWVYIAAKNIGIQTPLVVVKRPINQGVRRLEVVLDDSLSMLQSAPLSAANQVEISVRLTVSEDALSQDGDWVSANQVVSVNDHPSARFVIGDDSPIVTVQLHEQVSISPLESLFIIVRRLDVSTPPFAVRRIYGQPSQRGIQIDLADVMIPNQAIDRSQPYEVTARITRSPMATVQPEDLVSEPQRFQWGDTVSLHPNEPRSDANTQPSTRP